MIKISQSALKDYYKPDMCPTLFMAKYAEGLRTPPSDVMFRGLYFEHKLIGATRGGESVEFEPLKKGGKPQAQIDLDELVQYGKGIMKALNIEAVEVQPEWVVDGNILHPDLLAKVNGRLAIIDIKYTETKEDDRWNGWGNVEEMDHTQALHYTMGYQLLTGDFIPFYYLVFGKSGWVRFIKIGITPETFHAHVERVEKFKMDLSREKFEPKPSFNVCRNCPLESCDARSKFPEVEGIRI